VAIDFKELCKIICPIIKKMPMHWDGKKCILEMKENKGRWRDMEWIGFYFEYWCSRNLKGVMEMPCSKKYGNVSFDGYLNIPWDFKSHAIQLGKKDRIIVNDLQAIKKAINDFGCVGLIIASGPVVKENESQEFKKWHEKMKDDEQKGKKTDYVLKNIERGAPSRRRKVSMKISKISFVKLDNDCLDKYEIKHNQGRNSNGKPRKPKVALDLTEICDCTEYVIDNE
jgi:hypothetical protein